MGFNSGFKGLNAKVHHVGLYDALLYCVCEKRWSHLENSDCLALVSIVCSIQEPRRCVHDC